MMTLKDLEKVQKTFQEAGQDYQVELEDGRISIVGPSDIVSSEIGIRLSAFLFVWVNPRRLGRIFDSAGGFILPDANLTAPDVSFVHAARLRRSPRYFGELVPDLVSCSASKTHIVWYNMIIFRKSKCLLKTSSVLRQRKLCNKH